MEVWRQFVRCFLPDPAPCIDPPLGAECEWVAFASRVSQTPVPAARAACDTASRSRLRFPHRGRVAGPLFFSFVLIPLLHSPPPPPRTPLGLKTRPMEHPKGPPASSFSDVCSKLALSEADLRLIFFPLPPPPLVSSLLQHSLSLSSSFLLSLLFLFCRTYMFVVGQGLVC